MKYKAKSDISTPDVPGVITPFHESDSKESKQAAVLTKLEENGEERKHNANIKKLYTLDIGIIKRAMFLGNTYTLLSQVFGFVTPFRAVGIDADNKRIYAGEYQPGCLERIYDYIYFCKPDQPVERKLNLFEKLAQHKQKAILQLITYMSTMLLNYGRCLEEEREILQDFLRKDKKDSVAKGCSMAACKDNNAAIRMFILLNVRARSVVELACFGILWGTEFGYLFYLAIQQKNWLFLASSLIHLNIFSVGFFLISAALINQLFRWNLTALIGKQIKPELSSQNLITICQKLIKKLKKLQRMFNTNCSLQFIKYLIFFIPGMIGWGYSLTFVSLAYLLWSILKINEFVSFTVARFVNAIISCCVSKQQMMGQWPVVLQYSTSNRLIILGLTRLAFSITPFMCLFTPEVIPFISQFVSPLIHFSQNFGWANTLVDILTGDFSALYKNFLPALISAAGCFIYFLAEEQAERGLIKLMLSRAFVRTEGDTYLQRYGAVELENNRRAGRILRSNSMAKLDLKGEEAASPVRLFQPVDMKRTGSRLNLIQEESRGNNAAIEDLVSVGVVRPDDEKDHDHANNEVSQIGLPSSVVSMVSR